jgi:hypothetical protein
MPSTQDTEALELFKKLDETLGSTPAAGAATLGTVDICNTYSKARGTLQGLLTFIGLIPVYGGTIVTAKSC